jgi:hypothetical protein
MHRFNLSALAVRERAITLFFIIASAFAGIYAYFQLGRAEDPSFTVKVLTVTSVWPGATAEEMQDLVAEPLEKRLQELRWYDRVETVTRPGLALMTLQLSDKTPPKEVPEQFYQARKKLGDEARKLPQGAIGPFVNDEYSDVSFALYSVEAPGLPLRKLTRVAEDLRQRFLHVPGVRKVDIVGEQQERIFVEFSFQKLTTLGISPTEIFSALSRQNAMTPAGSVDTDGAQVFIRLDGAYTDIDKIRDTPIAVGVRSFKLSDIAEVTRGYEDPATFVIRHNGESTLVLSVVMREGWNGLDLGAALQAESDRISASLPVGISLKKITDQAVNISSAVDEFMIKFAGRDAGQPAEPRVAGWDHRGGGHPPDLGRGVRGHDDDGSGFRPDHLGRAHHFPGASGGRRHHRHRVHGGENGGRHGSHQGSRLCLEPHRGTDAFRHAGDGDRILAGGFRAFHGGGVCGKHLLDRRLRVDRLVVRGGDLHALPGGETSAQDRSRERRS